MLCCRLLSRSQILAAETKFEIVKATDNKVSLVKVAKKIRTILPVFDVVQPHLSNSRPSSSSLLCHIPIACTAGQTQKQKS